MEQICANSAEKKLYLVLFGQTSCKTQSFFYSSVLEKTQYFDIKLNEPVVTNYHKALKKPELKGKLLMGQRYLVTDR